MAFATLRAAPGLRTPSACSRSRAQPTITARCRPFFSKPPRAFYRNYGGWDDPSAEAMKEMQQTLNDMAKQWKETGSVSGGFFWPGGGYVYGAGRQQPKNNQSTTSQQGSSGASPASPQLPLDVVETPEGFYLLFADVPGLSKADLSIKLSKERVLTISGERKSAVEDDKMLKQRERGFGPFERRWELPEDADSEGISAKVAEGVLTITVPKKQPEPVVDDTQDITIN